MDGPVQIDGRFWHRAEDGSWLVWNPARAVWQPSSEPPRRSPPPPPPPPPEPEAARPVPTKPSSTQVQATAPISRLAGGASPRGSVARDFVAAAGHRLPSLSPLVLIVAAATLVLGTFAVAVLATRDADEPGAASPPPPIETAPPAGPVSPRNERNIYALAKHPERCFGPETLAWAGDPRAGGLDRQGLEDDIRRISRNLEDLRNRRYPDEVDVKLVPRARVGELAATVAAADIKARDRRIDERILIELGIISPKTNLKKLGRQVVSDGIAGFYVPRDRKLYAGISPEGFVSFDELILAHELAHALLDATIGLPSLEADDPLDSDQLAARRAAVEGDATLTMYHYAIASFDPAEWQELLEDPAAAGSIEAARAPYVLQRALMFPYQEGMLFSCDHFSRHGWRGVERTLRTPPNSTAQILFPDRYLRQTPVVDVPDPATPAGWKHVRATSVGAAELLWLIQDARNVPLSRPAAAVDMVRGWAGGELHAWERGDDFALQIALVDGGVEEKKGDVRYTLCRSLRSWYQTRFPTAKADSDAGTEMWRRGDTYASLTCEDRTPRLTLAPDRTTALELAGAGG